MDHRFRLADRHMVRAIRTFWTGFRYRILLDPAGCKRAQSEGVPLCSRVFNTLPRYYRLLRQDFLHRSQNLFEEQGEKDLQCGTDGNQP